MFLNSYADVDFANELKIHIKNHANRDDNANPRGEMTNNFFNAKRLGLSNFGASVIDKRIGNKAKDKRIETKIKRSTLTGSLRFNNNCPNPTKEKVTII